MRTTVIDLAPLLKPISPEAPSGEIDIEYHPFYPELEKRMNEGTSDQQGMIKGQDEKDGSESKGPNWQQIKKDAIELLKRGHNLRVAMFLMQALLKTNGLTGFYTGLELINGYIDHHWDTFYPRLDPAESNDPTARINILWELGEGKAIIESLKRVQLYSPDSMNRIALRTIHIANGKTAPNEADGDLPANPQMIEETFKACEPATLRDTRETIRRSVDSLRRMEAALEDRVGSSNVPDNSKLFAVLEEMAAFFDDRLPDASDGGRPRRYDEDVPADNPNTQMPDTGGVGQTGKSMRTITNRQDVIRGLDLICDYYNNNEPASPVPLLLKRARRLVDKNFIEIVEDLAPDSADQLKAMIGKVLDE